LYLDTFADYGGRTFPLLRLEAVLGFTSPLRQGKNTA
jgi:hypothetical protein